LARRAKAALAALTLAIMLPPTAASAQPASITGLNREVFASLERAGNWLMSNQNPDGTFSVQMDHVTPGYQDALLLGCAAMMLLDTYRLTKNATYLEAAERTLDLLTEWQQGDGSWGSRTHYTVGGVYYPIAAFAKHELYTHSGRYTEPLRMAVDKLISSVGEWNPKVHYIFEVGEYAYALLLAWRATGEEDYADVAESWIDFLTSRSAFDHSWGAWNTLVSGVGPQGMWDAVLPTLPLLLVEDDDLLSLANESAQYALKRLSSDEPGAFVASAVVSGSEGALLDDVYTDTENAYTHFSGEFLLLATIVGLDDQAERTAEWLMSMQSREGGFYFRRSPNGSIDDRIFLWDSFWAFFGLYEFLCKRLVSVAEVKLYEAESAVGEVGASGADTSVAENLLNRARQALQEEDYVEALLLAEQINGTLVESLTALESIYVAENLLREADRAGINVTDLRNSLSAAKEAYLSGNYTLTMEIARAVTKTANISVTQLRDQAKAMVMGAVAAIERAKSMGSDVSKAQAYLAVAEEALSSGLFSEAIRMAAVAKDLAEAAAEGGASEEPQQSALKVVLPLAAAGGAAAGMGVILTRRRREKIADRSRREREDILDKYVVLVEEG